MEDFAGARAVENGLNVFTRNSHSLNGIAKILRYGADIREILIGFLVHIHGLAGAGGDLQLVARFIAIALAGFDDNRHRI